LPGLCYGIALLAKASALVFGPLLLIVLELERRVGSTSNPVKPSARYWPGTSWRGFLPTSPFGRELAESWRLVWY
jgi:hypothetical protein